MSVKIFFVDHGSSATWIFLENEPMCSQGSTVYQKNKNNFVEGFVMGKNCQKCQKFAFRSTFEIHRIRRSVSFASKFFPNLRIFISFLNFLIDSHCSPFFRLVILLDIYKAYKISTIGDARHDQAYFKNRKY